LQIDVPVILEVPHQDGLVSVSLISFHFSFGKMDCRNCSSGRKLETPGCEILPVATVTALGIVLACMNDLTSERWVQLAASATFKHSPKRTWCILPKNRLIVSRGAKIDLFHPIQRLEESAPEHVPRVFAIGDAVNPTVLLELHDFTDGLLLDRDERLGRGGFVGDCISMFNQSLGSEERSNVLGAEGRVAW
jgi:hypothetical protein